MEVLDKPISAQAKRKPIGVWRNALIGGIVAGILLYGVPFIPFVVYWSDDIDMELYARLYHLQLWLGPLTYFGTLFITMFRFAAWGQRTNNHLKRIFITGAVALDLSIALTIASNIINDGPIILSSISIPILLMFHMGIGIVSLLLWYVPGNVAYFRNQVTVPDEAP